MAYEIAFYGPDAQESHFALGSVGAWQEFRRWAGSTDQSKYIYLAELAEEGSVEDTENLAMELHDALTYFPPGDGVRATAELLLDRIGLGDPDERIVLED